MAMERVWTDIVKLNPNPSASLCPTHESIHGHGYHSKSKPNGYPDIPWIPIGLHTIYITIIISKHFGIFLQHFSNNYMDIEGRGSGGHGRGRFDCLVCLARSE
jgi:hypothetical protein